MAAYTPKGVIDLTLLDPVLGVECVKKKVYYYGVALNEGHMTMATERMQKEIFEALFDDNSSIYSPQAVADQKNVKNGNLGKSPNKKQHLSKQLMYSGVQSSEIFRIPGFFRQFS